MVAQRASRWEVACFGRAVCHSALDAESRRWAILDPRLRGDEKVVRRLSEALSQFSLSFREKFCRGAASDSALDIWKEISEEQSRENAG